MIHIIWPEDRIVSDETIRGWFADAVEDKWVAPDRLGTKTVEGMAAVLQDIGFITIAKD
jgi:hypothetical protein